MAELLGVDIQLPLRERLVVVTGILQRRLTQVFNLMIAIRLHGPPEDHDARRKGAATANKQILNEVVRLLEPDRDQFRRPVPEVARVLRLLTFAGAHSMITDGHPLTAEEIASVVLDGTRHPRPRKANERGKHPC
jgi:hypothetical protein